MIKRRLPLLLDVLYVIALGVYILAGVPLTPFHGDEPMQVYMSGDYFTGVIDGRWSELVTAPPYEIDSAAQLRLINGTVNRYVIGAAWQIAGYTPNDLPPRPGWDWGLNYQQNVETNHRPVAGALNAARLPSALFTALSIGALFLLVRQLSGRPAAYVAAAVYALNPALLVNGRRALQEGSMLFFGLLTLSIAAWMSVRARIPRWAWGALIGCAVLTVASKHNAAVFVVAAWLWLVSAIVVPSTVAGPERLSYVAARGSDRALREKPYLLGGFILRFARLRKSVTERICWVRAPLVRFRPKSIAGGRSHLRWNSNYSILDEPSKRLATEVRLVTAPHQGERRTVTRIVGRLAALIVSGVVVVTGFVALSPALWNNPPAHVINLMQERARLLSIQISIDPRAPMSIGQRFGAIVTQPAIDPTMFYELARWADYEPISAEIDTYTASMWAGYGQFIGVLVTVLGGIGLLLVMWHWRWYNGVILWIEITAGSLLLNPLPWQRYYLPLIPVLAVLVGVLIGELHRILNAKSTHEQVH